MTATTQQSTDVPDGIEATSEVPDAPSRNWLTETGIAMAAGLTALVAFCLALLAGMTKPVSYSIVGLACLWLVSIGADRAVKRRRARR